MGAAIMVFSAAATQSVGITSKPRLGPASGPLDAIDIEPVDDQDMIKRGLEAREEAGSWGFKFSASAGRTHHAGDLAHALLRAIAR